MTRLAKLLFVVANSWLCCHCRNLARGSCLLLPFHFKLCRYFLGHVACRNLPWQGLLYISILEAKGTANDLGRLRIRLDILMLVVSSLIKIFGNSLLALCSVFVFV